MTPEDTISLIIWGTASIFISVMLGKLWGEVKGYKEGLRDGGKLMNNFLVREGLLDPKYLDLTKE